MPLKTASQDALLETPGPNATPMCGSPLHRSVCCRAGESGRSAGSGRGKRGVVREGEALHLVMRSPKDTKLVCAHLCSVSQDECALLTSQNVP